MNVSSKQSLEDLEKQNTYLFHGSGLQIENFEPRQAHTIIDGKNIPDGKPAIFASPFSDYAIFMALINMENCPKGFRAGCSYEKGKLLFRATEKTLEQITDAKGYVYIFKREDFAQKNKSEWISCKPIKPISLFPVKRSDFTLNIQKIK